MQISLGRIAATVAALGFPVLAQTQMTNGTFSSSTSANGGIVRGSMAFSGRVFFPGAPVTGAPYSAQRVSEHVMVAADGTRFTTINQQETIYRDSQGRIRTERSFMMGPNAPADAPVIIEIQDPVANVGYTFDTQNKVAHRAVYATPDSRPAMGGRIGAARSGVMTGSVLGMSNNTTEIMPATAPPPPPPPPGSGVPSAVMTTPLSAVRLAAPQAGNSRPHPEVSREDLGQQVIEGVMAEGHRFVQTWPVGSQGNDRPFQTTSETWYSPDIKETVLNKSVDPRSGESTMKLTNISLTEPSASLFMPPADYSVVDETGPFQIQWTAPKQ